jgi:hypothetical protein
MELSLVALGSIMIKNKALSIPAEVLPIQSMALVLLNATVDLRIRVVNTSLTIEEAKLTAKHSEIGSFMSI